MVLICCIDIVVVGVLIFLTVQRGLERALPFATFALVLVPFESRVNLGLFILTTQRLVVVTLAALSVAFPSNSKPPQNREAMPLKWLMLISVVWSFVAAANSIVPGMSFKSLVSLILDYYLLYYVFWRTMTGVGTIHRIMKAMVAALGVCSILGTIEVYSFWTVKSLFPVVTHIFGTGGGLTIDEERGLRDTTTFGHPILFGAALAIGITLAIYLLSVAKTAREKSFLWLAIFLMFLNIYKTMSRGPWIGLMIALALLLSFGPGQCRKHLLFIGALTLTVLLVRPGIWVTIKAVYVSSFNPATTTGSSYEYRYGLAHAAIKALGKDPLRMMWGFGQGSQYDLNLQGEVLGNPVTFLSCDSTWIGELLGTGYVGLCILMAMLFKPALLAWRDFRNKPQPGRYLSLVLLITLVTYCFIMLSVALFDQNWYILWILIAATVVCGRLKPAEALPASIAGKTPEINIRAMEAGVGNPVLLNGSHA